MMKLLLTPHIQPADDARRKGQNRDQTSRARHAMQNAIQFHSALQVNLPNSEMAYHNSDNASSKYYRCYYGVQARLGHSVNSIY